MENDLRIIISELVSQHDDHMRDTYSSFMAGEDVSEKWAYAAGLQHAIRTLQSYIE